MNGFLKGCVWGDLSGHIFLHLLYVVFVQCIVHEEKRLSIALIPMLKLTQVFMEDLVFTWDGTVLVYVSQWRWHQLREAQKVIVKLGHLRTSEIYSRLSLQDLYLLGNDVVFFISSNRHFHSLFTCLMTHIVMQNWTFNELTNLIYNKLPSTSFKS